MGNWVRPSGQDESASDGGGETNAEMRVGRASAVGPAAENTCSRGSRPKRKRGR